MPSVPAELQAEIVSIGTELLLGEITDTNASWLAAQLPALGIPLYRVQQVGDNRARLTATLRAAWDRANLLILTGGLGPTEDDMTREAIADLLGETMTVVPELEAELRDFFARRGRVMPERNVKQATVIPSAGALPNPAGTAPGWWVVHEGRYIAAMPGVPSEMRRMWSNEVVPRLLELPRGGVIVSRTLKLLGIGESTVEEQLGLLVRSTNPTVATYAKSDGIHVRLAARADNQDEAWRSIEAMEQQVRAIFGPSIYGADQESLPTATLSLVAAHGRRLAVAEAGLAGTLCAMTAGDVLAGGLMLPEEAEEASDAVLLAERARATFSRATLALGALVAPLGTDRYRIAVALLDEDFADARTEESGADLELARRRATLLAMQVLRERLQAS